MSLLIKSGGLRTMTMGGFAFEWDPVNNANDILLLGFAVNTNTNCTLRKAGASAGYVVPAAKTLYILAMEVENSSASVVCNAKLLYSDNDVGYSTATVFTNAVYAAGDSGQKFGFCAAGTGVKSAVGGINFGIPTGKYAGISNDGSTQGPYVRIFGKLIG